MMDYERIARAFREMVSDGRGLEMATVMSVDKAAATCKVSLVSEPDIGLEDIRLRAVADGSDTGLTLFPKPGSLVLISRDDACVLMFSEYESLTIKKEGKELGATLVKLLEAIEKLTVTTPNGESKIPTNLSSFLQIKQDLKTVFGP
jgi:hypothetical protein